MQSSIVRLLDRINGLAGRYGHYRKFFDGKRYTAIDAGMEGTEGR